MLENGIIQVLSIFPLHDTEGFVGTNHKAI